MHETYIDPSLEDMHGGQVAPEVPTHREREPKQVYIMFDSFEHAKAALQFVEEKGVFHDSLRQVADFRLDPDRPQGLRLDLGDTTPGYIDAIKKTFADAGIVPTGEVYTLNENEIAQQREWLEHEHAAGVETRKAEVIEFPGRGEKPEVDLGSLNKTA